MLQPDSYPCEERDRAEKIKAEKYELQKNYESEFQNALVCEKEEVCCINWKVYITVTEQRNLISGFPVPDKEISGEDYNGRDSRRNS